MEQEDKLLEAIGKIRRDEYHPWRYLWFTFLNGIFQGIGFALGATLIVGVVIYILSKVLTQLVDFPVLGYYFGEIAKMIDAYSKQLPRVR